MENEKNISIKKVALIKASRYRNSILFSIGHDIKTPSEISKEVNIRINHVSKVLKELKTENLVKCLNEEKTKGRLYELTDEGEEILNFLKSNLKKNRFILK
ncbi:MAG: winged helix DNA-binding protein [Methanobrevibacter sp.]|jgi:predicted transcriptional regulator|nr:winged helix DNA-binding protein [Candidatus Methanovirga aequatorialis]